MLRACNQVSLAIDEILNLSVIFLIDDKRNIWKYKIAWNFGTRYSTRNFDMLPWKDGVFADHINFVTEMSDVCILHTFSAQ